jgi:E3 ubiquitin-protein ligase SHPRH
LLAKYHDHAAKQAMALGDLRRATGTLRYLQNQQTVSSDESIPESCIVCLLPLDGECSVLKCGHRFHQRPCFDQILRRNAGHNVNCPLKCQIQTAKKDVMIASKLARKDGSISERKIKGSYGTKVTRIVSDILSMGDKGEKGVVFSQWNDMLDIIESALLENGVNISRPRSGHRFGECICAFQSPDCAVLLLNLKQGAEGLTLVHATNVFMIEPVMNK